jgi:hypothetical protein
MKKTELWKKLSQKATANNGSRRTKNIADFKMSILEKIDVELDRLLREEGKTPKKIHLGKRQIEEFIKEIMEDQESDIPGLAGEIALEETREMFMENDIFINENIPIIKSSKEDEFWIETNSELLN